MKKNMMKLVSVILVLTMVMMLGGCASEKKALVGTWESEINFAEYLNEGIDAAGDPELASYLYVDSFNITLVMTFDEDDTYSMSVDERALDNTVEQLKRDYQAGIERYLIDMMAAMGIDMTIDEIMATMGMSMEELIDSAITDDMIQELVDSFECRGKFKAADGKLHLSAGLNYEVENGMYEIYEIEGKTLTLLESVSDDIMDAELQELYPLEFTKVS